MALFVNQNENQTDLQKRIAADLREKAIKNSAGEGGADFGGGETDLVEDSSYIEGTKETTSLAFVWLLLFVAVVIAIIFVCIFG